MTKNATQKRRLYKKNPCKENTSSDFIFGKYVVPLLNSMKEYQDYQKIKINK